MPQSSLAHSGQRLTHLSPLVHTLRNATATEAAHV